MKEKCNYPSCKCEAKQVFPIVVTNEKNPKVDVVKAEMVFCNYHFYIVSGNHFTCKKVGDTQFEIHGPFKQVSLIEQCMAARLMMKKIREEEKKNLKTKKTT